MSKTINQFTNKELQQLHDYLLVAPLSPDQWFRNFQGWSKEYNRRHLYKVSRPSFQRSPSHPSMYIQCWMRDNWVQIVLDELST